MLFPRLRTGLLAVVVAQLLSTAQSFPLETKHDEAVSTLVDLGYAKYQGVANGDGVNHHLGMRYAKPPTGNNRWKAPQDPAAESGIQDASAFKSLCIGQGSSGDVQEDCLYINIYSPSNATTGSKLPVWFFIGGGGYATLADANFSGDKVIPASNYGMVFVELSYRVGAFGFLASENVRSDGDLNVGLLDQRKALQWVQKYIHLFGGDRDHVVIHGDSAGAGSIAYHLAAYGGRGPELFVGAMAESPFFPTHRTVAESEFQYAEFVDNVGCTSATDTMACLRSKTTDELQAADVIHSFPNAPGSPLPFWYWLPCIDGDFSPDYIYTQLETGRFKKVPLVVGDDNDEGTYFAPNANSQGEFVDFMTANYPHLSNVDIRRMKSFYREGQPAYPNHNAWYGPAVQAYGESTFVCAGNEMASAAASWVSPHKVWNYRYNVEDHDQVANGLGVPHVAEKTAIFGVGMENQCLNGCSYSTYNAPMIPIVMNYWISFILHLDPNTAKNSKAPKWKSWGKCGNTRLRFELNNTGMEAIPRDQQRRCSFWKSVARRIEQ